MKTKKNYLTVIVTILFAAGIWVLSGCGNSENRQNVNHQNKATEGEHQHDTDEQHKHDDITTSDYQCPMKCEGDKTYNNPGNCPECKMKLKKTSNDHKG